jgi:xanthine/uracil/vitamin C permease (AzgA family)
LLLVVLVLLLAPFEPRAVRVGLVAALALVFLFALWTSAVPGAAMITAIVIAVLAVIAAAAGQASGGHGPRVFVAAATATLCLLTVGVLLVRLIPRRQVSTRILAAAVVIYLLFGLLFAEVDALIGATHRAGFFAQPGPHDEVAYLYFSFITLTTVGYGDLTARTDGGRMLAAIEALLGQLYLVTVIAFVVSMRRRPGGPPDQSV